ncbi:hypothetical protein NX786_13015 [Telluria mixta]|uniref:Uncharacterized protein n=1 Tax=Telluria mixta TaxID=34071 RepID=A0ABT2BYP4_9BURK|nr:hypothetical protein [Telluria mixta]MCS0630258.1 hypothetical protein [Telluria mixta]WEM94433.1 hypothetical protein P0M04_23480 [Telluria mixta]
MLHMTVLAGGIATFCAALLFGAYPPCAWIEWVVAGRDAESEPAAD